MDLSTTYLGMQLRTPLVPSASPLTENVDNIKRMEDAGAAAVVFHSLFEEQISAQRHELNEAMTQGTESFAEALTYFPEPEHFHVGPETYLKNIAKARECTQIPIIGSLNGSTRGGWLDYARQIEQAGANALELNIYYVPTGTDLGGAEVEQTYIEILKTVKSEVTIPVAVKLGPFFTNFANVAKRLDEAGANGLVLFNRFYQTDIELGSLELTPSILLSTSRATRLPLRWIGILYGRINASLAASSGVHRAVDAIKLLMVGADVTMVCSVLLRHGISQLKVLEEDMRIWLEENEYESLSQLQGSVSQQKCDDPSAFERALYTRALASYRRGD